MNQFDVIAFAGGGNRCYWQGGFWQSFTAVHPQAPRRIVAVSAGGLQACLCVLGVGDAARARVFEACAARRPALDWRRLRSRRTPFVVGDLYRELIEDSFGAAELAALKKAPEILIQVSLPPRLLPGPLAALAAIGAYQVEKLATGAAYSRAGAYVGLKAAWISTHELESPAQLAEALMASSSVPPFMPVGDYHGRAALDGGLVDNPPLALLAQAEREGQSTLVLATRPRLPPEAPGRVVVGPSQPIKVDKFAISDAAGMRAAFELGLADGARFAERLSRGAGM